MFYGQISVFVILPVTARIVLRANLCFRHFARSRPHCFTGKSLFSMLCP
ncbi:MAG TPA: vitamin B12-binding protein [Lactobacillus sp.]|nr:vitamin B12-binding protein [Lactobacillus sp.]